MSHMYFLAKLFDFSDGKVRISAFYAGILSSVLTLITSFAENVLGIYVGLFIFLFVVMLADYITGRMAAKMEHQEMNSKRGLDWWFKMGFYGLVMGVLHMYRQQLLHDGHTWGDIPMRMIHYYLLLHVIYWEFKSIGENMTRMGRPMRIFNLFDDVFDMIKSLIKPKISAK